MLPDREKVRYTGRKQVCLMNPNNEVELNWKDDPFFLSFFLGDEQMKKIKCPPNPLSAIVSTVCLGLSLFSPLSPGPSRLVGEMSETQNSFHQSAATGIRKPVQAQQIPVQAQAL